MKVKLEVKEFGSPEIAGTLPESGEKIYCSRYVPLGRDYGYTHPVEGVWELGGHVKAWMYRHGLGDHGLLEVEATQVVDYQPQSRCADPRSRHDDAQNEWAQMTHCYKLRVPCANSDGDYVAETLVYTRSQIREKVIQKVSQA